MGFYGENLMGFYGPTKIADMELVWLILAPMDLGNALLYMTT